MATKRTLDAEEEQKRQPAVNNTTPAVDMQLVDTIKQQANQEYQVSNPTPAKPTLKTDPVDNIQREIDKTYQSGMDAVNKQAEAYKQQQVHLYDVAKGFKDELEAEREKDSRLRNQEDMRNIFGATGELVASLANLYQVGKGAPNAKIHPFTQDWMKEVDKKRKERKESVDNIRERQREAESKLNALKAEQDANLASARLAVEQNRAKQQIAYEQQKTEQAIAEQARKDKNAQQQWENDFRVERAAKEDAQYNKTQAYRDKEQNRLAVQAGMEWDAENKTYKFTGNRGSDGSGSGGSGRSTASSKSVIIRDQSNTKNYSVNPDFLNNVSQMAAAISYVNRQDPTVNYDTELSREDLQNIVGSLISSGDQHIREYMLQAGLMSEAGVNASSPTTTESEEVDFSDFN